MPQPTHFFRIDQKQNLQHHWCHVAVEWNLGKFYDIILGQRSSQINKLPFLNRPKNFPKRRLSRLLPWRIEEIKMIFSNCCQTILVFYASCVFTSTLFSNACMIKCCFMESKALVFSSHQPTNKTQQHPRGCWAQFIDNEDKCWKGSNSRPVANGN